ncbi:MAG: small subunit ribosomal protein [Patescibacteria group bacterium]|nr:small subunit ribosomal protein [Patescibacteria group bacterium]
MTEDVQKTEGAATEVAEEATTKKQKKSSRRQILKGRASIQCTYNNTIISLTDINGNVLGWSSSGHMGFKGAKKSTPYAATQVVADVTEKVKKFGLQEVEVFVNGVGNGREAAIRALANNGFSILGIKDTTSVPHGGCRPRRPRRI